MRNRDVEKRTGLGICYNSGSMSENRKMRFPAGQAAPEVDDYELMDSGDGRKYERFGNVSLVRPCSQAMWRPERPSEWSRATAAFDREDGNRWHNRGALPKEWTIETAGIRFRLSGTDFGHLGIFPEQRAQWKWIRETVKANGGSRNSVLNLFAYSGGSTMAAAAAMPMPMPMKSSLRC